MAKALRPLEGESEAEFMDRVSNDPVIRQDAEREAILTRQYAADCGVPAEALALAVEAASLAALAVVCVVTSPGERRAKAFLAAAKLLAFSLENTIGE